MNVLLNWILARSRDWHRVTTAIVALSSGFPATSPGAASPPEAPAARGAEAAPATAAALPAGDDELIIREVFRSHLPITLRKHALRLGVHPHLGDFNRKDHMRLSTGLRYGVTEKWEIRASSDLYASHGHGEVPSFERYGAANLEFGTKINLGQPFRRDWETTAGFDYIFPVDHPPAELTDGLRHFTPYITFSRRLDVARGMRIFWGLRVDAVDRTSNPGTFRRNDLRDSSTGATAGFVIDRRNLHYTFETSFDTTRLIGGTDEDVFMIRPGVIWEILSRRHPNRRSNWVIGAAISIQNGPDGTRIGGSLKVRYNLNLKTPSR